MNLDPIILSLDRNKCEGCPTAKALISCLAKRKDVWTSWDTTEALATIFLFVHDDTEPDTVTQEQHDALEEIVQWAGANALRILATVIRSNIGKD